jgi:hypothetical protein
MFPKLEWKAFLEAAVRNPATCLLLCLFVCFIDPGVRMGSRRLDLVSTGHARSGGVPGRGHARVDGG